jgi:hypothetical protein
MAPAYSIVQIVYWLSLSSWFGGVLFIAVAAPIIFRTIREFNPILPNVLSVNLENQHGTLLAGSIVGNLLEMLRRAELYCSCGTLLGLVGQWIIVDRHTPSQLTAMIFRSALFIAAAILVLYDWKGLSPRLWQCRARYIDHADEPEVANPAKELFDSLHRQSVILLCVRVCLLLGIILFSANISPAHWWH